MYYSKLNQYGRYAIELQKKIMFFVNYCDVCRSKLTNVSQEYANAANLLAYCLDTAVCAVSRLTTRTHPHEPEGLAADVRGREGKILWELNYILFNTTRAYL